MTDSEGRHPSRRLWRRVLGGAVTLAVVVVLGLMRLIEGGGGGEPPGAASGAATPSASPGRRLDCGRFEFPSCSATDVQFDPSFPDAGDFSGGFGGGSCQRRHTPVIFVHGNADHAVSWDSDIVGTVAGRPAPSRSVYDELLSRGYQPCELFGVTFLEATEQRMPQLNYHSPAKYRMILDFVADVQRTTGAAQVDIVSHSLGVSMAMAALTWSDEKGHQDAGWSDVRRFVNIAGGVRGLSSCLAVGFANPLATTCGSQNLLDPYVFGFFPSANGWTALSGRHSLAAMPARHPGVAFYTLSAGEHGPGSLLRRARGGTAVCPGCALPGGHQRARSAGRRCRLEGHEPRPGHLRRESVHRAGRRRRWRRTLQGPQQHRRDHLPDAGRRLCGACLSRDLCGHGLCGVVSSDERGCGQRSAEVDMREADTDADADRGEGHDPEPESSELT